eukprot:359012-Chlamydomonas_euryale.AAC.2
MGVQGWVSAQHYTVTSLLPTSLPSSSIPTVPGKGAGEGGGETKRADDSRKCCTWFCSNEARLWWRAATSSSSLPEYICSSLWTIPSLLIPTRPGRRRGGPHRRHAAAPSRAPARARRPMLAQ